DKPFRELIDTGPVHREMHGRRMSCAVKKQSTFPFGRRVYRYEQCIALVEGPIQLAVRGCPSQRPVPRPEISTLGLPQTIHNTGPCKIAITVPAFNDSLSFPLLRILTPGRILHRPHDLDFAIDPFSRFWIWQPVV